LLESAPRISAFKKSGHFLIGQDGAHRRRKKFGGAAIVGNPAENAFSF
jgi:hypothetical protein